jgi:TolB-like protein/DNA-binding winged helix-turn-helix (wHTH) protein/Tfp pilus assembly protein PilF
MPPAIKSLYFGSFELRTETRELYKAGIKLKLRPQAYQVLLLLAECSGEVVPREQLRERLWSQETYVDFEHGLNTAVKELRAVLSDSAAEPKYIQTLPRLGYRLMAAVTPERPAIVSQREAAVAVAVLDIQAKELVPQGGIAAEGNSAAPQGSALPAADSSRWLRALWWIPVAVALALVAATPFGWHRWFHNAKPPARQAVRQMIAVLPFENLTGDPAQEYFSDGLTEEMIDQLGRLDPAHLGVIGRNSVMSYKTNHEDTATIGRQLGVSYLLEGSVRRDSDEVRISAELIQVQDQASVWSRQYDRQLKDVLALQSEIVREIAGEIHLTLDDAGRDGIEAAQLQTPAANEAYDLYLRGLYFWNKRGAANIERATNYFQQAVQKDPSSARAYAGLAESYALVSGYAGVPPKDLLKKADAAARRAVALNDNLSEAHVAMAVVAQDCDWNWATAETEYRRAIQLNPNYATAHHWYGEYLALMGRFDESRAEMERARQLDPLSLIIAADNGVTLYYARQYDAAIQQFRAVIDLDPLFPRTAPLPFAYLRTGRNADAVAWTQEWRQRGDIGPWYWATTAYVDAHIGKMDEARAALNHLIRMRDRQQIDPLYLAVACLGLSENDQAIAWLQKAEAAHSVSLTAVKVEPVYDPLRGDPRFQGLLRQMNFPQ